ncbi:MAG: peptidoglycan DD-metalloendopeptidase family protein [Chitinophagaceae bacterium]|nr:peptidoglycan DD-metalloendopeptidase family protein [Chitinophagaceae bacterium]
MLKKHLLITLIFTSAATVLLAQPQDKAQLEKERQEIQNELKQIQGMYDKIKGQKKQSLGQLNMLKKKISLQERYINSINRELKMIDDDIYLSNLEIYRLQKQLDTLKSQYARSLVYAYKNRSNYDYVNFIFSSTSFNDAVRRISYLKSYRNYREKQVNTILETQQLIAKRQQQQLGRKQQKNIALQSQVKEKTVLDVQRKEKDAVVSDLKSQEKDLQKQLAAKKKRDRDIKNAIDAIVKREIAKAAEEAKRKAELERKNAVVSPNVVTPSSGTSTVKTTAEKIEVKKTSSYLDLNASDVKLNGEFQANRGRLPWPVDNGFVSVHFGPYTIEGTDLRDNNPGVTIATPSAGGSVKAVFDGEVVAIHNYGDGVAVVIRHGKYFTSYSNLSGVNVSKGAQVKTGQAIGRVGEAQDGSGGQVDFMLMIEKNNVNPEIWLRR